ncbi:MAG: HAMP domain-containing histidine kinase [Butyrivibrio sp.]|nr:HAMP domain-containing histidine kinase [Butyrivibrio sp.]
MKKSISLDKRFILRLVQHIMAGIIGFIIVFAITGSNIIIDGLYGDYSYTLKETDRNREYEESYLFNNILGNNISNIIRLVAIRTQMETDGEYDSEKNVDVTAYVNRGTSLPGDYISASYKLSDLLKWAQAGFEYQVLDAEEASQFLNSYTIYTHLENNSVSGGMNSYLNSQIDNNIILTSISGNSEENGSGSHTVLINRYQSADGKNIEDYVSSWSEYEELCANVVEAARDLELNYSEHLETLSYYNYGNTNIRYYVSRSIGGKTEVYTNVDSLMGETTGVNIAEVFEDYGKYIYYCPYELKYESNTLISESVIQSIIKDYDYAFPDKIKVYIGVDTTYPCEDEITQGKEGFLQYVPYYKELYGLGVVAILIYLLIMIYLIIKEGHVKYNKKKNEDGTESYEGGIWFSNGITLEAKDKIFTEAMFLITIIIIALPIAVLFALPMKFGSSVYNSVFYPLIAAVCLFIADFGFGFGIYSYARRRKAHELWNYSFTRWLGKNGKNLVVNTIQNSNIVIRTWVPYILFLLLNLGLLTLRTPGLVVAIVIDIFVGISLYNINKERQEIINGITNIKNGDVKFKVDSNNIHSENMVLADAVNSIGDGIEKAVSTSMKDEKLKADLITNVSHDIKTPLTSIINYVDLLKRENIDNPKAKEYIAVLDEKSQRLKQLTEDLVEASKISSGNITMEFQRIDYVEMINQTIGEFYEKFEQKGLKPVFKYDKDSIFIMADARHLWRVLENLLNNVFKYALENTRVYLDLKVVEQEGINKAVLSIKNISATELNNINADDLTERFIRGDVSRTTEGSGLGLSIAKNLTLSQKGSFEIMLDGDLFKVEIIFDEVI